MSGSGAGQARAVIERRYCAHQDSQIRAVELLLKKKAGAGKENAGGTNAGEDGTEIKGDSAYGRIIP